MTNWIKGAVDTSKIPEGERKQYLVDFLAHPAIPNLRVPFISSYHIDCGQIQRHAPIETVVALLDGGVVFTQDELKEMKYWYSELAKEKNVQISVNAYQKIQSMLNPQPEPELPEILEHPEFGECIAYKDVIESRAMIKGNYYRFQDDSLSRAQLINAHNAGMKSLKDITDG